MKLTKLWLLASSLLVTTNLFAQQGIRYCLHNPIPADTLDLAYYGDKKPLQASSMVVGINLGVWAFDRYLRKADFAYIDWKSMRNNFRRGFVWDNDGMGTNMFMHPYHGSLYFNSARSNGYNFWQSGLFAFAGSAMWELVMENEYPSTNDIIATPIGGMAIGEVSYRVSDLILDDRKTGGNRVGKEVAAFLISPMRGLTRLLTGDAWHKRTTSGKQLGIPELSIELSAGARVLELEDEILDKGTGIATQVRIEYGDRFDSEQCQPYDYFSILANLNLQASQPLLGRLNILGRLASCELIDTHHHYLNLGLYQHFDYYDSDTISSVSSRTPYKFCTPASVGIGGMYHYKGSQTWNFDGYAHINAILLGASLSDYYHVVDRNYNLASGYSIKVGANLVYKKDKLSLSGNYEVYHMFTWKGYPQDIDWKNYNPKTLNAQGDKSTAILHAIGLRADIKLRHKLYLTGALMNYTRHTQYRYHEDVSSCTFEGRVMLTWKI